MDQIDCIEEVITIINSKRDVYQNLTKLLEKFLHLLFPNAPKIEARTKAAGSIAGKILKKYIQIGDANTIYGKLTDLVGGRVIFLRKDEVENASGVIRKYFLVDDYNSQNTGERLNDAEFGYQSRHYTVICNKEWLGSIQTMATLGANDEIAALQEFFEKEPNHQIFVELQIRTWLQHVWADLSHDVFYKGNMEIPHDLRRFWSSIAAILENTDENIMKCLDKLEQYNTNGTYYIKTDLDKRIDNLEIINKFLDPKYYVNDASQSSWAATTLTKNQKELAWLKHLKAGKSGNVITAEEKPEVALEKDSTHPRLLLYYLTAKDEITCDVILKSLLTVAVKRCDDMIASSLELPWAFAGKVFFLLLLHSSESAKVTDDNAVIYDSVLRLLDLCNERSVSNLADEWIVATNDSFNALQKLKHSIDKFFKTTDESKDDVASLVECVKKLLTLGLYAHVDSHNLRSQAEPVVVIAGGCKSLDENKEELDDFQKLFDASLSCGEQKITFLLGGGDSGICSLKFHGNPVERFGIRTDANAAKHHSPYLHHSLNEALMEWEYLQERKYRFDDVALVGYGLGPISNFECRIALALGARVTVIRHKNFHSYERSFGKVPYWSKHPSLIDLPVAYHENPQNKSFDYREDNWQDSFNEFRNNCFPEPIMLRTFMLFKPYHREDYIQIEADSLALLIHRIKRLKTMAKPDDLKDLDKEKRRSEQHRMLSFKTLYKDVPDLEDKLITATNNIHLSEYEGDMSIAGIKNWLDKIQEPDLIDYGFAEREHARWYIERWLQGTRYGRNKIEKGVPATQKRNPYMVAWYDLDDDTILKDTDYLRRYVFANAVLQKKAMFDAINRCFEKNK